MLALLLLSQLAMAQSPLVAFSRPGGFYEDSFALELSCGEACHICFTVNGDTPTDSSMRYQSPLYLDTTLYSPSNIYTIRDCLSSVFYLPDDVERAIVIRAAAFDDDGNRVSPVATQSYFIRALGCDLHGLPVLSIVTDSLSLFDYETGILVPGASFNPEDSVFSGNYYNRGRDWERLINMEFYEPDNQGINQQCGLRVHGGASRGFQQKGLRLYAREEYGKKRFSHRFFEMTPIYKFKRLNLHPFRCSNWLQTGGQDFLSQSIAANLNFESLAVRQTVVFINGEYWGIYTLEESADERYLEDHYDVSLNEVVLMKYWGVPEYGDLTEWRALFSWMREADLTQPEDSTFAYTHIDVPCFIDYLLFETFSANLDWPCNNVRIWQPVAGEPFRMFFYDGDGCFSWYWYNAMENATQQDLCSLIINRFLENPYFKEDVYRRYLELKSTHLSYESMKAVLDHYRDIVDGEVDGQAARFQFPTNRDRWLTDMDSADRFLQRRHWYYETEWEWNVLPQHQQEVLSACYPNPSAGKFRMGAMAATSGDYAVEVVDMMGRRVYAKTVALQDGENQIDMDVSLPAGLYVVKVGAATQRIVIE